MTSSAAIPGQSRTSHVVGFSGHRQLANVTGVTAAIRETLESLRREVSAEWSALSSAAAGADLLFVRSVLDLNMPWEASLPLPLSDFQHDFPPNEWNEVKALIALAKQAQIVAANGSREDAYLAGGLDVVNRCDVLLVVWDGRPARGKGGTADIVAHARAIGRPLVIIDAESLAISRERCEALRGVRT